jgi:hypothetical protein
MGLRDASSHQNSLEFSDGLKVLNPSKSKGEIARLIGWGEVIHI